MDGEFNVVISWEDETGRWGRLNISARQKYKKGHKTALWTILHEGKAGGAESSGKGIFYQGWYVLKKKEMILEGKESDQKKWTQQLFQEASKDDTGFVLVMYFLQNLSISNSFMRMMINDNMSKNCIGIIRWEKGNRK